MEKLARYLGLIYILRALGQFYIKQVCKKEYLNQLPDIRNERTIELSFLFKNLIELAPKTILDVGTGMTALPHVLSNCGFIVSAVDNIRDYWPKGMFNRHFHVINDDITDAEIGGSYDCITCISVLEHINDFNSAMRSMSGLLKVGGFLLITFPYNDRAYYYNVYKHPDSTVVKEYPFVTQAFSDKEIADWCEKFSLSKIKQEYWQFFEGDYWTCGQELARPRMVNSNENHQLTCLVFKKLS